MAIAPLFSSACELARNMPTLVAEFLELDAMLGRRFREDSVTDVIIASLVNLPENRVAVILPREAVTGSDFDIVIVDPGTNETIQYRIQAKRLHAHHSKWRSGCYRELDHPNGTGQQAKTLIEAAAREKIPTIPLYAFYNPEHVCRESGDAVSGVELASGVSVQALVNILVNAKPRRPPLKRLGTLQSLFFPLSTILCPPTSLVATQPSATVTPRASRDAVERAIRSRPWQPGGELLRKLEQMEVKLPPLLDGLQNFVQIEEHRKVPAMIQQAIKLRSRQRYTWANVKCPKVILVS